MPMPRKPTSVLEAEGAFVAHPERRRARKNEPKATGELGKPPKYMSKAEKQIWKELSGLIPQGVAAKCDRWIVEIACQLMTKLRSRTIMVGELAHLRASLSLLGLTPADRSRVQVEPAQSQVDVWANFDEPHKA